MTDGQRTPAWRQCVCCAEATKTGLETRVIWCYVGIVCPDGKAIRKSCCSADVSLAFTQKLYCYYYICYVSLSPIVWKWGRNKVACKPIYMPLKRPAPLLDVGSGRYQFERADPKPRSSHAPMRNYIICTYSLTTISVIWDIAVDGSKVCYVMLIFIS